MSDAKFWFLFWLLVFTFVVALVAILVTNVSPTKESVSALAICQSEDVDAAKIACFEAVTRLYPSPEKP